MTLSLCTYTDLDSPWPIFVEMSPGKIASVEIKPGDAAIFMGTKMKHWRETLICKPDQKVIQSFYHWKVLLHDTYFCQFG